MSMISEQVKELRDCVKKWQNFENVSSSEPFKLLNEAADTIESLSAKLADMERPAEDCGKELSDAKEEQHKMRQMPVTLKTYVARYKYDNNLLSKYPKNKELLERRIKEHEKAIIEYVTSDRFQTALASLNL